MNTEQILLEIIDLSFAIKDNDIGTAIIKVDNINTHFSESDLNSGQLKELLGLINNYDQLTINETFYYVLNNLVHLKNSKEILKELEVMQLVRNYSESQNTTEIKNYIEKHILDAISIFDYKILIKLANIIQDYDLLYSIKKLIQKEGS